MLAEIVAFLLTLFLGPIMYVVIGRNTPKSLKKFPISIADGIGDIFLWPLFNALAVAYGLLAFSFDWRLLIAAFISALLSRWFLLWRKNVAVHNDWTRPKRGNFNVAGWYHLGFFFAQGTVFFWTMLNVPKIFALWIPPILFALLICYRIFVHLPRQLSKER